MRWSMMRKKWFLMTMLTMIAIYKASISKNEKEKTAPFASGRPCDFLKQSHRFHVLCINHHDHQFQCQQHLQQGLLDVSSFLCREVNILLFGKCDIPLWPFHQGIGHRQVVVYFELAKLAKNAIVSEYFILGLIYQNHYTPQSTEGMLGPSN